MDPNGAPLPQVPEVPIAPVEAPILPPVAEATPQYIEQVPVVAPAVAEPTFNIPQVVQPEVVTPPTVLGDITQNVTEPISPVAPPIVAVQNVSPETPSQAPQVLEEPETPEVPAVKDIQGLERYRQPDELGFALEATLGSEVG